MLCIEIGNWRPNSVSGIPDCIGRPSIYHIQVVPRIVTAILHTFIHCPYDGQLLKNSQLLQSASGRLLAINNKPYNISSLLLHHHSLASHSQPDTGIAWSNSLTETLQFLNQMRVIPHLHILHRSPSLTCTPASCADTHQANSSLHLWEHLVYRERRQCVDRIQPAQTSGILHQRIRLHVGRAAHRGHGQATRRHGWLECRPVAKRNSVVLEC